MLLVLAIRFDLAKRRPLAIASVLCIIAIALLLGIFWNHQSGILGQLVRPFHSFYEPDPRDFLSNAYRQAEDQNLLLTIRSSPIFGIGFGLPMLYIYPMADISKQYPLWNIIPHNTLLWIGMRMGAIGLAAFFGLIAFAIAAIGMELTVGYVDLQLDNYRNLIFLGILLGVIQRLPRIRGIGARVEPMQPLMSVDQAGSTRRSAARRDRRTAAASGTSHAASVR